MATGKPIKLALLSPPALWKYERSKSASAATAAAAAAGGTSHAASIPTAFGPGWATTPATFLAQQRQRFRRLKRRVAASGLNGSIPLGVGGAHVSSGLHRPSSKRSGSRVGVGGDLRLTPVVRGKRLGGVVDGVGEATGAVAAAGRGALGGAVPIVTPGGGWAEQESENAGVVGHVWVSLKLRDPFMLLMKVVRQWNMARDEASVQQRRAAQAEAKR